jgi:hypothetical protein
VTFFEVQNGIALLLTLVLLAVKAFALVDCVARKDADFSSSMPKRNWLIILVLALVAHLLIWEPLSLLNLLGTVAAFVYLAQLRGSRV